MISIDPVTGNRTILSDNIHGNGDPLFESFPDESRNSFSIAVAATGERLVVDHSRVVSIDPATGNRRVRSSTRGHMGTGPGFFGRAGAFVESGGTVLVVVRVDRAVVRVDLRTGNRTCFPAAARSPVCRPRDPGRTW